MSILSNSSNASARHEIDSKLRTMRMRITGTQLEEGGAEMASFYIFSKACYLHKDYIKLLEEIFPKPPAHIRRWCFSPLFFFSLHQQKNKLPPVIPNRCGRASSFSFFWCQGKKSTSLLVFARCLFTATFPRVLMKLFISWVFFLFRRQHHYLELSTKKYWGCRRLQKKMLVHFKGF